MGLVWVFSNWICFKLLCLPFHLCPRLPPGLRSQPLWDGPVSFRFWAQRRCPQPSGKQHLLCSCSQISHFFCSNKQWDWEVKPLTAAHKGCRHICIWICEAKLTMRRQLWAWMLIWHQSWLQSCRLSTGGGWMSWSAALSVSTFKAELYTRSFTHSLWNPWRYGLKRPNWITTLCPDLSDWIYERCRRRPALLLLQGGVWKQQCARMLRPSVQLKPFTFFRGFLMRTWRRTSMLWCQPTAQVPNSISAAPYPR